jgi:hypothetical protein
MIILLLLLSYLQYIFDDNQVINPPIKDPAIKAIYRSNDSDIDMLLEIGQKFISTRELLLIAKMIAIIIMGVVISQYKKRIVPSLMNRSPL